MRPDSSRKDDAEGVQSCLAVVMSRLPCIGIGMALVLALAGCVSAKNEPQATQSNSSSATSPAATPSEEPATAPEPVSCDTIIPAETIAAYEALDNFDLIETPLDSGEQFRDLGGIQCAWGKPRTDTLNVFSWSPITPELAAAKQAELEAEGFVRQDIAEGAEYAQDPADWGVHFVFSDGYWVEATNTTAPFFTAPELAARAASFQ